MEHPVGHPVVVDRAKAAVLGELLASSGWTDRTRWFARALRSSTAKADPLLLVGTPTEEPWHFAAHLDNEAQFADLPGLRPTLVRYSPPPGAPEHLAIGLERLEQARRGETLFVVAPDAPPESLLDRIDNAKHVGATILSIDAGNRDLAGLAHEQLVVPNLGADLTSTGASGLVVPDADWDADWSVPAVSFDAVEHLVSLAAGEPIGVLDLAGGRRRRNRLARLVEELTAGRGHRQW
jgi:hypothetical protein